MLAVVSEKCLRQQKSSQHFENQHLQSREMQTRLGTMLQQSGLENSVGSGEWGKMFLKQMWESTKWTGKKSWKVLESVRSSDFLEHGFLVGFVFYSFLPYLSISSITFGTSKAALDFCSEVWKRRTWAWPGSALRPIEPMFRDDNEMIMNFNRCSMVFIGFHRFFIDFHRFSQVFIDFHGFSEVFINFS